jgi:hypothetical protein
MYEKRGTMKRLFVVNLLLIVGIIFFFIACTSVISKKSREKFGYINMYGEEVIPVQYDWAFPFSEGLAAVSIDSKYEFIDAGKYGFINKEGHVQIPFDYDYALCFQEGLAVVGKNKKIGYINREGKTVIPFEYEGGTNFRDGIAGVIKNGKLGYIDKEGNVVIDCIYDNIFRIAHASEEMIPVELDKKWGYIDTTGAVIIPFEFYRAAPFYSGRAYVSVNGDHFGFIDVNGDILVPLIYQYTPDNPYNEERTNIFLNCSIYSVDYGFAYVGVITERYGWRTLINRWDRFSGGYALVKKDGKYGFIDPKGNMVVPFEYDNATEFAHGIGYVAKRKEGTYNYKWYRFTLPGFDFAAIPEGLTPFLTVHNGDTYVRNENTGKSGILDRDLNYREFPEKEGLPAPPIYDRIYPFTEGMAVVSRSIN